MSGQRIAITGSTGLIGGALSTFLSERGDTVIPIVRSAQPGPGALPLVPGDAQAHEALVAGLREVDAIVNMAGAPVAGRLWTPAYKQTLRSSRLDTTGEIVQALAEVDSPVRLVSSSANGYYGDGGERVLDESAPAGAGFLPELVGDWEAAADQARNAGHSVVLARTCIVISRQGGALVPLRRLTQVGLNGPFGSGQQWWSWISLQDEVRALVHLLDQPEVDGPVNLCAPLPIRQGDFARAMGRSARRPAFLPAPERAIRTVLGGFSGELLDSRRVKPVALSESGFEWRDTNLDQLLDRTLA